MDSELPLGRELDSRVERDRQRRALLRRAASGCLGLAVGQLARVGQRDDLARLAADRPVVGVLEAREAPVVQTDVAEDRGGKRPFRIEPLGLRDEVDPGNLESADLVGGRRFHLARRSRRSPSSASDARGSSRAGSRSSGARAEAAAARIFDVVGNRVDRGDFDRDRELPAFAVQDRAAPARDLDAPLLLPLRPRAVLGALHELELRQGGR